MSSFTLPINLGKPVNRMLPDDILPYIQMDQWQSLCDAFDRLSMNPIDRYGSILMRLSLLVGAICLVAVVLFGYLDLDDGDKNDEGDDGDDAPPTLLVLLTAIPISFPFIMAALLNCHNASTVSKIIHLFRTRCDEWASEKGVEVRVEQLQSVSNEDQVIDKILIEFGPGVAKGVEESDSVPTTYTSASARSRYIPHEKDAASDEADV
uniref:Uncharacterized protein n=1 Tax=Amphora coffeiformis TaxID=265554 RepID=A0A7S3PEI4_9STRA